MKIKYFILGLVVVILDRITKLLVINKSFNVIPGVLELTYTENRGIAFGMANSNMSMIIMVSLAIIIGMLIYVVSERERISNLSPYILVISGGIGNLIDRLVRGNVVDFINFKIFNFPSFNVADICVVIGIIWIIIGALIKISKEKNESK